MSASASEIELSGFVGRAAKGEDAEGASGNDETLVTTS